MVNGLNTTGMCLTINRLDSYLSYTPNRYKAPTKFCDYFVEDIYTYSSTYNTAVKLKETKIDISETSYLL